MYSPSHIQTCPLAGPSNLACRSFSELEPATTRGSSDLQMHTMETERLLDVTVSHLPLFLQPAHLLGAINRVLSPTTKPSPTLTQEPLPWKTSHRIPKSGPLWPTQTIPRCLHPLCVLGFISKTRQKLQALISAYKHLQSSQATQSRGQIVSAHSFSSKGNMEIILSQNCNCLCELQ